MINKGNPIDCSPDSKAVWNGRQNIRPRITWPSENLSKEGRMCWLLLFFISLERGNCVGYPCWSRDACYFLSHYGGCANTCSNWTNANIIGLRCIFWGFEPCYAIESVFCQRKVLFMRALNRMLLKKTNSCVINYMPVWMEINAEPLHLRAL